MGRKHPPLRFELPIDAEPPRLVNPERGVARASVRAGSDVPVDVTVLDTPDCRLLRAGVILAHRISDGIGDWYFAAPDWSVLPNERVEPVGAAAELPEQFARWIRPIHRLALIGPIAAVRRRRTEYTLRDEAGDAVGEVRDDIVSVRRGGATVAKYREVTVQPKGLDEDGIAAITDALCAVGTPTDAFPRLQDRIGPPATGLSDFPDPEPLYDQMTLDRFVRRLFALRLRDVVLADLVLLRGKASSRALVAALHKTALDVRGLSSVLEPRWRETLEGELAVLSHIDPDSTERPLQGQELLGVIDSLVSAARAPRLGDLSQHSADEVFIEKVTAGTVILLDRCVSLQVDAPTERWVAALRAAEQLRFTAAVGAELRPRVAKKFLKLLDRLIEGLEPATRDVAGITDEALAELTLREAWQVGYDTARAQDDVAASRAEFVSVWPGDIKALRKLVKRA